MFFAVLPVLEDLLQPGRRRRSEVARWKPNIGVGGVIFGRDGAPGCRAWWINPTMPSSPSPRRRTTRCWRLETTLYNERDLGSAEPERLSMMPGPASTEVEDEPAITTAVSTAFQSAMVVALLAAGGTPGRSWWNPASVQLTRVESRDTCWRARHGMVAALASAVDWELPPRVSLMAHRQSHDERASAD